MIEFLKYIIDFLKCVVEFLNENFNAITLIGSLVAGIIALHQWRYSNKTNRAEYLLTLSNKIREDDDIVKTLYVLEYNEIIWYGKEGFVVKDEEATFDKTFALFNYICYMNKNHNITRKEFLLFEYKICRIANNDSFQNYFYNLYWWNKANGTKMSFIYLFEYMKKKKLLPVDFYERNSDKYDKVLNF